MSLEQKINYQLNKCPLIKKALTRVYQRAMVVLSPKFTSEGPAPFKYDTHSNMHPRRNHAGDKICFDSIFEGGHRGGYEVAAHNKIRYTSEHFISVAMCSYNGEKYIEDQMTSILQQTLKPNEIVVCDDGSTDSTLRVLETLRDKFKDIEIRVYKNNKHLGYSKNFLHAIRKCKGDIVFLADQDDIWHRTKIEKIVKVFDEHHDALAVSCAYSLIGSSGEPIKNWLAVPQKSTGKVRKVSWKEFVLSPRFPGMSMAIRSHLLSLLADLPDHLLPAHDWLLNEAAAYGYGMYYLEIILTQYRQHGSNSVGVIKGNTKEDLLKSRMLTLLSFRKTHEAILWMHKERDIQEWGKKLQVLDEQRRINIENRTIFGCIITYMTNIHNMTRRCFAGDLYTIIRMK